jgi:hypothetical protein
MKVRLLIKAYLLAFIMTQQAAQSQVQQEIKEQPGLLHTLLLQHPSYFDTILKNQEEYKVQVIYTKIDRKKKGQPVFSDFHYKTDTNNYYYPASTVKLPVAILALQKLRELNIPGLDMNTTMITGSNGDGQTEVHNDPTAPDGRPTIAHYIKKIFLVSDNDAFNRLYEFLGQEYINRSLHSMGYTDLQIIHRLAISLTEAQNRHTNPITFYDTAGKVIYRKEAMISKWPYQVKDIRIGKGYISGDGLVAEPFNFSMKNRMSLYTNHRLLRSVIFPEAVPHVQRFNLSADDYVFLRKYMSMLPGESVNPSYDPTEFWDNYVKMILNGVEKKPVNPSIRIFNKSGWSYGFLTDVVYVADFKNNVEFMASATIYCNKDGILNDNKYDYESVGYPFMKHLGEVLHRHELERKRKNPADLSQLKFDYSY